MSEAYQKSLQNSIHRKVNDIARYEMIKKLLSVLGQEDRVLLRNMSKRGRIGKMQSFWEELVRVVVKDINNENITYIIKRPHLGNCQSKMIIWKKV